MLHLRARWYSPSTGTFLSVDPVESEPPYQYVRGNPVNRADPLGLAPDCQEEKCKIELGSSRTFESANIGLAADGPLNSSGHLVIVHTNRIGMKTVIDALPDDVTVPWQERVQSGNFKDTGFLDFFDPLTHPRDGVAGILRSHIDFNQQRINDFINGEAVMMTTIQEGPEVCDAIACLKNAMEQIERNQIAYWLLGPNSNSAAMSALTSCGFGIKGREALRNFQDNGRYHPGSHQYLLDWLANSREDREPSTKTYFCLVFPELCQQEQS